MIIINDMKTNMHTKKNQEGITLLITLLLMGVLLGVSSSLLNITLKQFQLSGIAFASEVAFQAANAGMECALYHDFPQSGTGEFDVPPDGTEQASQPEIACVGESAVSADDTLDDDQNGRMKSGEEQNFQFTWGDPGFRVCSDISVYKFSDATNDVPVEVNGVDMRGGVPCPANSVCTVIQSRGYNVECDDIESGLRVVEREYTQVY